MEWVRLSKGTINDKKILKILFSLLGSLNSSHSVPWRAFYYFVSSSYVINSSTHTSHSFKIHIPICHKFWHWHVQVITKYLAPLKDLTIIELRCNGAHIVKLDWVAPKYAFQIVVYPTFSPLAFVMVGKNHWMIANLLYQSIQAKFRLLGRKPKSLKLSETCPRNWQNLFLNEFGEIVNRITYFCKSFWV